MNHPSTTSTIGFDFLPRTQIVYGVNTLDRIGSIARELGANRVLIVTDKGIVGAGHVARACASLDEAGLSVFVFDEVNENPSTTDVDNCLQMARYVGTDLFIGLGGGSSLDTAKGCNFLLTNGGEMKDYWGVGKATQPMLPMIAAPTTSGTGSECQSFALIADAVTHHKMACGDPKAAPRVAILDPSLTISQPHQVTACTGMDAITHAVETAVTTRRTEMSSLFSREAFRLTIHNLTRVLAHPDDLDARGAMLLGAAYAGVAIENSMLGAAHSMSNPLTAHYRLVHGHAVGMMLPRIVRFNGEVDSARAGYESLVSQAGLGEGNPVEILAAKLEQVFHTTGLTMTLEETPFRSEDIPVLAAEAAKQWTATFNPRPVSVEQFEELYSMA